MTSLSTRTGPRLLGWLAVVALIELTTRVLVYALAPDQLPLAQNLRSDLGGPQPVAAALIALTLGAGLSAGIVWLATLGVRERWQLDDDARLLPAPVLPVRLVARRAFVLWVAAMLAFAAVESYIHWRAGLGFHGLSCLVGPVHRNAIPVAGALAMIAAAAISAAAHMLRWMRRRLGRLLGTRPALRPTHHVPRPATRAGPLRAAVTGALGARAPPLLAV